MAAFAASDLHGQGFPRDFLYARRFLNFQVSRSQRFLGSYIVLVELTSEIRPLEIAFVSVSTYEISVIIGNSSELSFKR